MLAILFLSFIISFSTISCRVLHKSTPIVEISDGNISGFESSTFNQKEFYGFQGIPYASPPIGNLRFADPQPISKWTDVKDCTNKTVVCVQFEGEISELESEDCLILNVFTPKLPKSENDSDLAVMVYLHGGGYYIGNTTYEYYGPEYFMDHDVVIVSVNYRLGPFGFLSTSDEIIPGNFGLKDQQLGLKWVRNNIKKFGGDPDKVLIFGNSAGSSSVGFHILNRKNEGLFRAAIMSSGTPLNSWSFQKDPKKIAFEYARILNRTKTMKNSKELLSYLRSIPTEDLRKAAITQHQLDPLEFDRALNGYFYAPSNNPSDENGFLENPIYESLEIGNFSHVPIMIGFTSEEFSFVLNYIEYCKDEIRKYDSNHETLVSHLYNPEKKREIGDALYKIYNKNNETMEKNVKNVMRFWSDFVFNNAIRKYAELTSKFTNAFFYQFSFSGEVGGHPLSLEGTNLVGHTKDLSYVWRRYVNNAKEFETLPENDKLMQKRMLKFYINFAKYLNPTYNDDPLFEGIKWKPVNISNNDISYLDINTKLEMRINPKHETYSKWNKIFLKYAMKPYNTV